MSEDEVTHQTVIEDLKAELERVKAGREEINQWYADLAYKYDALRSHAEKLAEACEEIPQAMNDALIIYCPDEFTEEHRLESSRRRQEEGTIGYFVRRRMRLEEALVAYRAFTKGDGK